MLPFELSVRVFQDKAFFFRFLGLSGHRVLWLPSLFEPELCFSATRIDTTVSILVATALTILQFVARVLYFFYAPPAYHSTITRSLPLRPNTSGVYISSALAGGTMNSPGVVARAR